MGLFDIVLVVTCVDCKIERKFHKYDVNRGRHLKPRCRLCAIAHKKATNAEIVAARRKAFQRAYYELHKPRLDAYANEWRAAKRLELIATLGGRCKHCGEADAVVLDFDHIANDGAAHRRETRQRNVITLLCRYPDDIVKFQLLCKNCNWRKEIARRTENAHSK